METPSHHTRVLSLVIPFFNEEENVTAVVEPIVAVLQAEGIPHELVLVDNGSRDATRRRIQDVMYQHPGSLRVGRHQEHIHITFLTPDGQNTAVVRDPPDATMEELLKRIIAIEDRLTRQAA